MNYEEIESLLTKAEAENEKSKFEEAERLCNLVLEKIQIFSAHEVDKSASRPHTESGEDFKRIANLRAKALNGLSSSLWRRGMAKDAISPAKEALHASIQSENKKEEAQALNSLGNGCRLLSDYPGSLAYFSKSIAINVEIGDKEGLAINSGNIGRVYMNISDYPQALEYFSKALSIYEEIGNKSGVANNTGNIGTVYQNLFDYPRALEHFSKALAVFEEIGRKDGVAANSGNLGIVYCELSDYPRAIEYFTKALAINEEIGSKWGIAGNTLYIGNVYHLLSDYPRALEYFTKALAINEEIGDKSRLANIIGNIGGLYGTIEFEGYDAKKAEDYMLKAIAKYEEIGVKIFGFHIVLAKLYKSLGRWEEALKYYEQYHDLEKEVVSEEAKRQSELMEYRRKIEESERDRQVKLARFQEQEKILLNILPAQIAERILEGEKQIADLHEHVSVFFSDIVGFTQLSQKVTPDALLTMLNEIFSEFDRIARKHGLEKIKTIGDAYMAVAGVPIDCEDHAQKAAAFAVDVIEYMKVYRQTSNSELQIRVGLHCGRAIAGVIGENKFAYDLWGDSVNTASRMESHGEAGRIHVSEEFRNALSKSSYNFNERGEMEVKGKGKMKTYFLEK